MIKNKINCRLMTLFLSLFCMPVWSYEQGEVRLQAGMQTIQVSLNEGDFTSNVPGTQVVKEWQHPETQYHAYIYCPNGPIRTEGSIYYKTESLFGPVKSDGFISLNDYISVKVEVLIDGHHNGYEIIPFTDVDNKDPQYRCLNSGGTLQPDHPVGTVSHGKVTYRLDKPLINGVELDNVNFFKIYARHSSIGSAYGDEALFLLQIKSDVLGVPEKCEFNQGQLIDVNFGEIGTEGLDGNNWQKAMPITYECKGGIFDKEDGEVYPINLMLKGASTAEDYLKTNVDKLNIKVVNDDGSQLIPNKVYSMPDSKGTWSLRAAPVAAADAALQPGDFSASATVIASFP
ncbi:fimbrial protein [Pantoea endophytica]|uniref:fimbrial protein n=1 Tax=Pantoea endophytica TaxID=92488 RepID=UPI0030176FC5